MPKLRRSVPATIVGVMLFVCVALGFAALGSGCGTPPDGSGDGTDSSSESEWPDVSETSYLFKGRETYSTDWGPSITCPTPSEKDNVTVYDSDSDCLSVDLHTDGEDFFGIGGDDAGFLYLGPIEILVFNRHERGSSSYERYSYEGVEQYYSSFSDSPDYSNYEFRQFATRRISGHDIHLYRRTYETHTETDSGEDLIDYHEEIHAMLQTESNFLRIEASYTSADEDYHDSVDGERLLTDFLDECELHDM